MNPAPPNENNNANDVKDTTITLKFIDLTDALERWYWIGSAVTNIQFHIGLNHITELADAAKSPEGRSKSLDEMGFTSNTDKIIEEVNERLRELELKPLNTTEAKFVTSQCIQGSRKYVKENWNEDKSKQIMEYWNDFVTKHSLK